MAKKDAAKSASKGKAQPEDTGIKIVARNRKARHEYELLERVAAWALAEGGH